MVNTNKVKELKELPYEDGTLFHFLFKSYKKDCQNTLAIIEELSKSDNTKLLLKKIHYLKNSCSNIGATDPTRICSNIYKDIEKEDKIDLEKIEELKFSIKNSINELKTHL